MQGAWFRSLVGELRSLMLHGIAKKKKDRENNCYLTVILQVLNEIVIADNVYDYLCKTGLLGEAGDR